MSTKSLLVALAVLLPSVVLAADPDRGRDIAQQQCAACHSIAHDLGKEFAAAPPFEVIGRKNRFDERALTLFVHGPHPKMNFAVTWQDAADIAAYISTLAR